MNIEEEQENHQLKREAMNFEEEEEESPNNAEDEAWQKEVIKGIAKSIHEEAGLKQLVIDKEREMTEKTKKLEILKASFLSSFGDGNSDEVTLQITEYEKFCIENLEKRVEYLQQRADRLKYELEVAQNRESAEGGSFANNDQASLVLQENVNDILYENKTLEKYIRSENFRIFDENIGCLRYNLDQLKQKLTDVTDTRLHLEKGEKNKRKFLEKLQRKYKELSGE